MMKLIDVTKEGKKGLEKVEGGGRDGGYASKATPPSRIPEELMRRQMKSSFK